MSCEPVRPSKEDSVSFDKQTTWEGAPFSVAVLMKAVPASTEVVMDPVTHTIVRDGGAAVLNPYDTAALELALKLKAQLEGEGVPVAISVLSMGIPATADLLRDAVARGATRALLLSDRAFAGSDTLATSYALELGLRELGDQDLVLCGKMAVDGDTAQIGPEVAAGRGWPCVTGTLSVEMVPSSQMTRATLAEAGLVVSQVFEGEKKRVGVPLPCVVTVDKDAATLRMPSVTGVLEAQKIQVEVRGAAQLGADLAQCGLEGSPTQVVRCCVPEASGACQFLAGSPAQIAEQLGAIVDQSEGA